MKSLAKHTGNDGIFLFTALLKHRSFLVIFVVEGMMWRNLIIELFETLSELYVGKLKAK